MNFKGIF